MTEPLWRRTRNNILVSWELCSHISKCLCHENTLKISVYPKYLDSPVLISNMYCVWSWVWLLRYIIKIILLPLKQYLSSDLTFLTDSGEFYLNHGLDPFFLRVVIQSGKLFHGTNKMRKEAIEIILMIWHFNNNSDIINMYEIVLSGFLSLHMHYV